MAWSSRTLTAGAADGQVRAVTLKPSPAAGMLKQMCSSRQLGAAGHNVVHTQHTLLPVFHQLNMGCVYMLYPGVRCTAAHPLLDEVVSSLTHGWCVWLRYAPPFKSVTVMLLLP